MVRRFLYLNGLAITCVVLFHAAGMGFVAMFSWAHQYGGVPGEQVGSFTYFMLRFVEQIVIFSISAFLMVSGYFIGIATGRDQKTVSWRIVLSRVIYLAIPYLIWSGVALGLKFFEGNGVPRDKILIALLTGKTNEVYYFIPVLIQFYLISPLLILWARASWKSMLLTMGLIQLVISLSQYSLFLGNISGFWNDLVYFTPKWLFISRILWFPLGIILANKPVEFKRAFYPIRWWLLGIAIVLIPLGMVEWEYFVRASGEQWLSTRETLLDNIYGLCLIFGILAFEKGKFPLFDSFSKLGTKSFGIYLTHVLVIEYIARIIYRFWPSILANQTILQPLLIITGLGLPLLLMWIVNHTPLRRFSTYLFG